MKLLLFVCFLAVAAADNCLQHADRIDEIQSLTRALEIDDPEIEQLADDARNELGRVLRETLQEMLEKLKEHIANGKTVGRDFIEKVKELRDRLKEVGGKQGEKVKEMFKEIQEKAKEILKNLLERLGHGKSFADNDLDQVVHYGFKDFINKIKNKFLSEEDIQKIREYFKNLVGGDSMLKSLKMIFEIASDKDLREILSHFISYGPEQSVVKRQNMKESWDKLKTFFKGLNLKIQEGSKKFAQWVKDRWNKGISALKEKFGALKAIAMEFLSHANQMNEEMAREALVFFQAYQYDLGPTWTEITDVTQRIIANQ